MNSESLEKLNFTRQTVEDSEKYASRYRGRTPWNDDSDSEDSDVVSVSSFEEVEDEARCTDTDRKTTDVTNKEVINDTDLHLSDAEEGELAEEESEVSEVARISVEKVKDGVLFSEKSDHFPFESIGSKTTSMSFLTEGKYPKKGVSPLLRPKYDNYRELCAAELHCTPEENKERLNQRARRFGLDVPPEVQVPKEELNALYLSLGILSDKLNAGKLKNLRLDTIHIRGVEEMDTSDVVQYFDGFMPWSLEWVNDYSCNVLFKDEHYSAKALLNLSKVKEVGEENNTERKVCEDMHMLSDVKLNVDDSSLCSARDIEDISDEAVEMEVDKLPTSASIKESPFFKIPVPPGKWRAGLPCPKAEMLLMRFATKDDRKLPGAEKRSRFYQKYGNPNYGGLKGLISSSRKRKFQSGWHQQEDIRISSESITQPTNDDKMMHNSSDDDSFVMGQKRVRMRMYADDIEGPWQKITSGSDKKYGLLLLRKWQEKVN